MLFIKIEDGKPTGYPVLESNFRDLIPNGNKQVITKELASSFGFGIYEYGKKPTPKRYEVVLDSEITLDKSGKYIQQYSVRDMTEEEKIELDNLKCESERERRDFFLRRQVDSLNIIRWNEMTEEKKQEWISYRKNLLDVPEQIGFPWDIQWPDMPK